MTHITQAYELLDLTWPPMLMWCAASDSSSPITASQGEGDCDRLGHVCLSGLFHLHLQLFLQMMIACWDSSTPPITTHTHTLRSPNAQRHSNYNLVIYPAPSLPSANGRIVIRPSTNCAWVFLGELSQSQSLWEVTCASITHISGTVDVPSATKQADQTQVALVGSSETETSGHLYRNRNFLKECFVSVLRVFYHSNSLHSSLSASHLSTQLL